MLKEIAEKLRIARGTAHVLQEALSMGDSDLESRSADALNGQYEMLDECRQAIRDRAWPRLPTPPTRKRANPDVGRPTLSVVRAASSDAA
jgi:hypothetical protein